MSTPPLSHLIHTILSYDGNIMLAAIIALLLVFLFVLLLHLYAKYFLAQSRDPNRRSVLVPHVVRARARFRHFPTFTIDATFLNSPTKGLDSSVVASIPLFVYGVNEYKRENGLECVICLSLFEDGETGRKLPKCGHGFHVECIDMWLSCHSTCPICREAVVCDNGELRPEARSTVESVILEIREEVPNSECGVGNDWVSECSSSAQAASLGDSFKRMMSGNRSERKVHPSSNVGELND